MHHVGTTTGPARASRAHCGRIRGWRGVTSADSTRSVEVRIMQPTGLGCIYSLEQRCNRRERERLAPVDEGAERIG